jgi:hypothetical protein
MAPKPRSRAKRVAWLRRYLVVLRGRLEKGFLEAWYRGKHFPVNRQERDCREKLRQTAAELETLTS